MGTVFTYNGMTFRDNAIIEGSIQRTKSPINADFQYDTFDIVIKDENMDGVYLIDSQSVSLADSSGELLQGWGQEAPTNFKAFVRGTAGQLYKDNVFVGKFYIDSVERVAKYEWRLNFISALGLLDTIPHKGGVYGGVSVGTIIHEIIGGTSQGTSQGYQTFTGGIFDYKIQTTMSSQAMSGWLPYSTSSRENLHQILFATGGSLVKTANFVVFEFWQPSQSVTIPDNRFYISGKSVEYRAKPKKVIITEHEFKPTDLDQEVTLLQTQNGVNNQLVKFDKPCHDLLWNGSALPSGTYGANYAIVSGNGTLTGKEYSHTTKDVTKVISSDTNIKENTYTVSDMTLVNSLNSQNVAERVASYYNDAEIVNYGMVVTGDVTVGNRIRFTDPYGIQVEGYIESEDITLSNVLKSITRIATNWTPNHVGNQWNYCEVLTTQGQSYRPSTETLSQTNPTARIVVFGGFQGGGGSYAGSAGESAGTYGSENEEGAGGAGGAGGVGGSQVWMNYKDITLTNRNYTLSLVGTGGAGGSKQNGDTAPTLGQIGTHSICDGLDSHSSGNATLLTTGYSNPLTGEVYGDKASDGLTGASGGIGFDGRGGNIVFDNVTYTGGSYGNYAEAYYNPSTGTYWRRAYASGGGGGGATLGANGGNGANGVAYRTGNSWRGYGGVGGTGATQPAMAQASLGKCGKGASGGGGGGGGGTAYEYGSTAELGAGGAGGQGQNGQQGSNGFALIFHN